MPDLPTPQDATEAALFSEGWDAVLSYADLCTSGSVTAHQLATEAFALGVREVRAAERTHVRGAGRRGARLPTIPALLTAVRDTAAGWEADGNGHKLDPELRLWLNSGQAARCSGPPLERPIALRGLRDMQEADASLLWLAEVEALPLPVVARRLGLDPATVGDELDQVRTLFRDRCHRAHLDTPLDAQCRSYARLLDAVTRSPAADTPGDLSRHLATCVRCAEAAACLRLHGGGLPAALAGGVVGWGGLAYLERRRRAAEVRLGAGRPGAEADPGDNEEGGGRNRGLRGGLLFAAGLLSALALGVSMMPFGGSGDATAAGGRDDRQPVADPSVSRSAGRSADRPAPPSTTVGSPSVTPSPSGTATHPGRTQPDPEPQGSTSTAEQQSGAAGPAGGSCRVAYDVVSQWTAGFQAAVTVTTDRPLADWQVSWSYHDGQQVGQMWDATVHQDGARVTAAAADYNRTVAAHGTLSFGFLATWQDANRAPYDFTLNGASCAVG